MIAADDPRHGQHAGYAAGCRQECCARARRRASARWQYLTAQGHKFKVSTERSRRKVGALAMLGWSIKDVAHAMGIARQSLTESLSHDQILATTAERIDAAYDALCMAVPEPSIYVTRTKNAARAAGHHPPLAWEDIDAGILAETPDEDGGIDEMIVEHVLQANDFDLVLTKAEKIEVMRRWLASGRSERSLCLLTGWREGRYAPTTTNA